MFEQHSLLRLACDLAFFWCWLAVYDRIVPNSGVRRVAGIVGWLLGVDRVSRNECEHLFARWDASHHFNAWAMPIDLFEKLGVLAAIGAFALIVLANRGTERHAATAN